MNNLGLPIGADPSRDIPWGTDELGNQQFRSANGTIYSIRQQAEPQRQTQPGTMARVGEVAKGLLSDVIQGIAAGITAPRRALEGGDGVTGADALNLAGLLQVGGGAVAKPKGALGANALRQVDEYGGHHRAPRRADDVGAALSDPREMFGGEDIYTSNAMRYYGHGDPAMDRESLRAINMARSNPDAEITVYRAVPKDLEGAQINAGDWVTPSRRYAKLHGEGPLGGDYQVIEQKVRAGDLFTEGDIHEWGYDPLSTSANRSATAGAIVLPAARNEAEAMAKNILEMRAAGRASEVTNEMMSQADPQYMYANTPLPMDEASRMARAGEMGMVPAYRGTLSDEVAARPKQFVSENQDVTQSFAGHISFADEVGLPPELAQAEGGNIMPLLVDPRGNTSTLSGYEMLLPGAAIRSRFARFDPEFSHLSNLNAANVSPEVGLLATQPTDADKEAILRYLGAQGLLR